jgi:hypothetical protein
MTDDSPHAEDAGLTPAEEAFLAAHGGVVPGSFNQAEAARHVRQSPWATGLEGALAPADVAKLLRVPGNEVERLAASGALYSVDVEGVRHFPGWQFSGDRSLPHLAEVLASLQDAHPATVAGFMTLPNDELDGLSPARWLAANRPVKAVLWLAETLLTW